jgi:phage shock protein C
MQSGQLVRSKNDRMIAGVCGGLAKWLGWDPTAVRILYVLVSFFSAAFPGILVYLILALVMPAGEWREARKPIASARCPLSATMDFRPAE